MGHYLLLLLCRSRCVGAAHHWPQDSGFASAAPYGIGKGGDLQMQARFAARCPPDHVRLMPLFQAQHGGCMTQPCVILFALFSSLIKQS
jgi:hypothetical protein